MFLIKISEDAQFDIKEIITYYNKIEFSLSKKFMKDLEKSISKIAKNPYNFQIRYKSVRISFTKTFPYGIHFIIDKILYLCLKCFTQKDFLNSIFVNLDDKIYNTQLKAKSLR